MPTTTGLATSFITFSRPGASGGGATTTDRDGKIKWAGHNLVLHSESFDNSYWTRTGLNSVAANSIAAPDGLTTADKLVEDTANSGHLVTSQNISVVAGATYTASVFCKPAGRDFAMFQFNMGGVNSYAICDLTTATFGTPTNASGTATFSAASIGNGWVRMTVTATTSSATAGTLLIYAASNATTFSYAGDITKGIYAWGAHLYRSDLGGMQANPAMPAGMQSYYPTTPRNALGWTEDFSNAAWVKANTTVTANTIVAPNGLQTADKLVETTANDIHTVRQEITNVSGRYTFSAHVKAAERSRVIISMTDNTTGDASIGIDLTNGTTFATGIGVGSWTSVSAGTPVAIGDGWYRVSITATRGAGTQTVGRLFIVQSGTTYSYTGDGTSGIYLWGAQLSDSASLDTYVPQYGAAVTSAAYYAPRLDFDPVTLAAKGLLVEEARTNLLLRSNDMSQAVWTAYSSALSTTVNAAVGPDSLTSAAAITLSANARVQIVGSLTSGATYTLSVWMRTDTGTKNITLSDVNDTASPVTVTVTTTWQRFTFTYAKANTTAYVGINQAAGTSPSTSGTLYVWGWQFEAGSFPTSLIPTGSATATRAADVASVSTQAFPYSSSEGTLVANFVPTLTVANNIRAAALSDGTNRVIDIYTQTSQWLTYNGTTNVSPGSNSAAVNANVKFAAAYKSGDYAAAMNGGTVGTQATTTVNTATKIDIGANIAGASQLNGHIRQITYLPRRISNADLIARTA